MAGVSDPRPPLPEWIIECYDHIRSKAVEAAQTADSAQSIEYETAIDTLLSDTELVADREDAEYALTRLLDRGYLYEVETQLRVTTPEE